VFSVSALEVIIDDSPKKKVAVLEFSNSSPKISSFLNTQGEEMLQILNLQLGESRFRDFFSCDSQILSYTEY
jgi:hypothetical protein